jgi:hypothetical protein
MSLLETWSRAIFYAVGLGLVVITVLIITANFKLAFGLAFGILALLFLEKFEKRRSF